MGELRGRKGKTSGVMEMIEPVDLAIFVLWSAICFSIGRLVGRADRTEAYRIIGTAKKACKFFLPKNPCTECLVHPTDDTDILGICKNCRSDIQQDIEDLHMKNTLNFAHEYEKLWDE